MAPAARQTALVLLFSGGYFASILAGQALSLPDLQFATFWPAAGWLLAALAIIPIRHWPQFVFAACVINVYHAVAWDRHPLTTALIFMAANVLEGVMGGLILQRIAAGSFEFAKIPQVLFFAAVSITTPLIGALIGVWGLSTVNDVSRFQLFFQLWWQADSVGILLVTPLFVALAPRLSGREATVFFTRWQRCLEAVALYVGLCIVVWLTFSPYFNAPIWSLIGLIYTVALLAWAGLRFSRLGATVASTVVVTIALYHTARGDGLFAFATDVPMMQVMSIQSFALVTMLTPLLFATVIDDQRRAEEKLRYNLSILQSVLDNTTDLIYVKDLEGRYLLVNQASADLIRLPVDKIVGHLDAEMIPPDHVDGVRQRDQFVFAAGHALTFEETTGLHGQKHTFLTTKSPYRNAAGEIVGLVGLSRDVTQRIAQVEALAESEQRYRTLVTSSNIGIYETDRQGKSIYLNPHWSQLTGMPAEAGLGDGWAACLHPDDRQPVAEAFQSALATGSEFRMEYRYMTPNGGINWVLGTAVPIRDLDDNITGYLGSVVDITDQKRAKDELELHVAERTVALQAANAQLQQLLVERTRAEEVQQQQQAQLAHVSRLSVMGEMAAGLAHELNQPLFAIQNYTAGILRRWSGPEDCSPALRDVIQQIAQESTRAAVIIRRVRDFARKQLGERVLLSANSIIEEVLQLLASEIRQQHVEVRLSLAEELPTILIDRVQLQQVLVNLIRNSVEAMEGVPPPSRVLTISTFLASAEVHCVVEDAGPGIPEDCWQRLFEPFFTTKRSGLGMGLSISRSIVEAHGGRLQAETARRGAVFHFTIPLLEDQADDPISVHADRVFGG